MHRSAAPTAPRTGYRRDRLHSLAACRPSTREASAPDVVASALEAQRASSPDALLAALAAEGSLAPPETSVLASALLVRGVACYRLGLSTTADVDLRCALAFDPSCADARLALGAVLLIRGDPQAALEQLDRAVGCSNELARVNNRAIAHAKAAGGRRAR